MSYAWVACSSCLKLENVWSDPFEFADKHLFECGKKASILISESAWWHYCGYMQDGDGRPAKGWQRVTVTSNYDRRLRKWIVAEPLTSDYSNKRLWVFCEKCEVIQYLKFEVAEYRQFVDLHISKHPERSRFQVSKRLSMFQSFDSRSVFFSVGERAPRTVSRTHMTRVNPAKLTQELLEIFKSNLVRGPDKDDCEVFIDKSKISAYYHRDVFTFVEKIKDKKRGRFRTNLVKLHPLDIVWSEVNGEIPADYFIKITCGNRHCVNLRHLVLEKRPLPVVDDLRQDPPQKQMVSSSSVFDQDSV